MERFVARMLPIMARQLVRAGKLPAATRPAALVWLLARMRPQVGLQVARLGVGLIANIVIGAGVQCQLLGPFVGAAAALWFHDSGGCLRIGAFN